MYQHLDEGEEALTLSCTAPRSPHGGAGDPPDWAQQSESGNRHRAALTGHSTDSRFIWLQNKDLIR